MIPMFFYNFISMYLEIYIFVSHIMLFLYTKKINVTHDLKKIPFSIIVIMKYAIRSIIIQCVIKPQIFIKHLRVIVANNALEVTCP